MILFKDIKQILQVRESGNIPLRGASMKKLPTISNAYLIVKDKEIFEYGSMENLPNLEFKETINCKGQILLPTWYDSHTHLVYTGTREQEFVDKINGLSYEDIAARGGGILNSAEKVQQATEEDIFNQAETRLKSVIKQGTGGIEIKSGYGLTPDAELKLLRVAKKLKSKYDLPIKTTFLGAHTYPKNYQNKKSEFMDLMQNYTLDKVAEEGLADYVDAFCESNYFSVDDTLMAIKSGLKHNLKAKVHTNQFTSIGGVQACVENNTVSVDHLEVMTPEDIDCLANSNTIATVLPSCSFYINIPYAPAKRLIEKNAILALASDYNPGSTPSGNMKFVVSLACIQMKLTPEEAINAATLNGAFALELGADYGSITKGKKANFILTKQIPSYNYIPYSFGEDIIDKVYIHGKIF